MAADPLVLRGCLEVNVIDVLFQLRDLRGRDRQPSSASASASATHSRRQVPSFRCGLKTSLISAEA
jgi:hypothetical protein